MKQKNKAFDCVDMKNTIQAELFSEYLKRKSDFSSFAKFITATAAIDPVILKFRKKMAKKKPQTLSNQFSIEAKVI